MEHKYPEGSTVYSKVDPTIALVIRRYVDRIYYCQVKADPSQKEQVYFEREITDIASE